MALLADLAAGDRQADRIVPRTGHGARLTVGVAAAMAFLAVFAMALTLGASRIAASWSDSLSNVATIRISAPQERLDALETEVRTILDQTPGVASAQTIGAEEQAALLEPWLGPDLPLETLRLPRLIDVVDASPPYDRDGLRLRLQAEMPEAVLDDHTRWREGMVDAATRVRLLGWLSLALMTGVLAAMVTLAANVALAANLEIIRVLRLVGSRDAYIVRAFTRRFALRSLFGSVLGALAGMGALALLPNANVLGGPDESLVLSGVGWVLPLLIPPAATILAFAATRRATFRALARFE
ncbi:MAG: FtsX-like permease family protein [Pseudomonadota bacterium]